MRRGRTVDASRPSRAPRPNRAARPSESCKMNIQVEGSRTTAPRARPSRCHGPPGCAYARALGRAYARHARPSKPLSRTAGPCIRPSTPPCTRSTRALGRAYARAHPQSCPSYLEHSVLHTLRYEQYVLLLLIYL